MTNNYVSAYKRYLIEPSHRYKKKIQKLDKMQLKVIIIIAMSVATGQRPLEYMSNSNNMSTADLLPMMAYILGQAGSGPSTIVGSQIVTRVFNLRFILLDPIKPVSTAEDSLMDTIRQRKENSKLMKLYKLRNQFKLE